jgi:hypothetical protein
MKRRKLLVDTKSGPKWSFHPNGTTENKLTRRKNTKRAILKVRK